MQFTQDATAMTADGQKAGHIKWVIMEPRSGELTHIVLHKGFLFNEDKVVPIDLVAAADDKNVSLRVDAEGLRSLPNFEETHYVNEEAVPHDMEGRSVPALYWYPPLSPGIFETGAGYWEWPRGSETTRNIPPAAVALKEGAKVIAADNKHVGNVEEILTDHQTDRVTYFVVSKGLVLKEQKLVPIAWVHRVNEEEVYLAVSSGLLDRLRPHDTVWSRRPALLAAHS